MVMCRICNLVVPKPIISALCLIERKFRNVSNESTKLHHFGLKTICLQNGFNWFGFLKTFLVFTNFLTVATWTEQRQKRSCHSHHCIVENDPTCYLLSSMVSQQHTFVTQMRVGLKCKLSSKQLCKPIADLCFDFS